MPTAQSSAVLALPYIQPAQAQKHVTHNEALRTLDAIVQLAVLDRTRSDPPATPAGGDRHLVIAPDAGTASGAWTGQENAVAVYDDGVWSFHAPRPGWLAWIADEGAMRVWSGTEWRQIGTGGSGDANLDAETLGLNATADAQNRLSVAAPGTLLGHDGAGHQLKINKAAAVDTASLLFQTGFSGRAEMGTTGSDAFSVKVSADGTVWTTALSVAPGTGAVALAPETSIGGQMALHRGNVVGPVSQSGGVPTGAVLERGTTATGTWVRHADGTQICTHYLTTGDTAAVTWTFPAAFADPQVSVTATPVAAAARIVTVQGTTGTSVSVNGWSVTSTRVSFGTNLVAVGRWY